MDKKVIVLILSFNGKHLLNDSVSSYLANDYPNFELIVIDNGSTDATRDYVQEKWPEVRVLRTEKNLGYSGGFNFGLHFAFKEQQADYVLITNNDVKADKGVISALVKVADMDPMIGFVTGKVYFYDQPDTIQTVGYYEDTLRWVGGHIGHGEIDQGQYENITERSFSDDIFMLAKRSVYSATKGYDTEFQFQAEQFDWQIRAKKSGFKIYYTPFAKIWHKESMTIGRTSPFKTYYDVRNSLVVRLKHREIEYLKKYVPWYLKNSVLMPVIKNFIKGRFSYAKSIIFGFCSACLWWLANYKIFINKFNSTRLLYSRVRLKIRRLFISDKTYVIKKFKNNFGRKPDLDFPKTYNEHISKILLTYNDPVAVSCVDKLLVREYVKKRIGNHILNDLYGVYYKVEEVKQALPGLPDSFVLKAKHGCAWNYVCKNKKDIKWNKLKMNLNHWLKSNFYYAQREKVYKDLKPGIVCEKYLEDETGGLMDYKIHCFHGKPEFINVIVDRFVEMKLNTYDTDWNFINISFSKHYPNDINLVIKSPDKLGELLKYSRILSQDFPYVRCDFYIVSNHIIFGELTFTPGNGTYSFSEEEDLLLGDFFNEKR